MVKLAFVAAAVAAGVAVASGEVAAATGGGAAREHAASLRKVSIQGMQAVKTKKKSALPRIPPSTK
jgi:hypothetical protein